MQSPTQPSFSFLHQQHPQRGRRRAPVLVHRWRQHDTTLSGLFTLACFHYPIARDASQRGLPTWRYLFSGRFTEELPYAWMRPYHGSDLDLDITTVLVRSESPRMRMSARRLRRSTGICAGLDRFGWPRYKTRMESKIALVLGRASSTD